MAFKPSTWAQPATDIAKEYEQYDKAETEVEVQTAPEAISQSMVRRGVLDPNTGGMLHGTKSNKITEDNARGFSTRGKMNYERIFGHS